MRIIGICGHDFCGSTLLSRLFAAIPSVASGGELRWLLTDPNKRGRCCICGDSCNVFTKSMKKGITEKNLYKRVGNAFKKEILVSSDKGYKQYERYVKYGTMTGIVLFRSIEGIASSDKKHQKIWPYTRRKTVKSSLRNWMKIYRKLLKWAPVFCSDYVILSYETLVSDYARVMTALCERLEIPMNGTFPSGSLVDNYHNILGNPSAHNSREVRQDDSWKKRLTKKEIDYIHCHTRAQRLYNKLRKRSFV